ncbi:MAG: tetratricopeptide repeat protein [Treponema sp.]
MNMKNFVLIAAAVFASSQISALSRQKRVEVSVESAYLDSAADKPANILFAEALRAHLDEHDIDGAIKLFDTLPPDLAADKQIKVLKASLLLSAGRLEESSHLTAELLKADGANPDVLELNAQLALANGNRQKMQSVLKQILAAEPNNAFANVALGNQQAQGKKYELAAKYYKKALVKEPKNEDALFGLGRMAYFQGKMKEAKETLEKLLAINPNNSDGLAYMGKIFGDEEKYLSASNYMKKAIALDSSNYDYFIDLGQYERYQGHFKEAEEAWTKAIALDPSYFLAYTYRAGLYDEQNKFKEALADYRKINETNPKYYFAHEETGILEFHLKNWEAARNAFTQANAISDSAAYKLMIIITYLRENNLAEAKKYAQSAMRSLNRDSLEYKIVRLFHDQGGASAENGIARDLDKESDKTKRGKMLFYFAQYYELKNFPQIAEEYYAKILKMHAPLFFEYRLAEWSSMK